MSYLEEIVAHHRAAAAADPRDAEALWHSALASPSSVDATIALRVPGVGVIAEIKRRSPSRGELVSELDVAQWVARYAAQGARAISVLTDEKYFGGSLHDLNVAHKSCSLPLLRKDFVVSKSQIADARIAGAALVLLIVDALSDSELVEFIDASKSLGLLALVEAHDGAEITRAVNAGASCIGINQRDLQTFEIDRNRAVDLAEQLPRDVIRIAESGIIDTQDVERMGSAGYNAVLVGESILSAKNPDEQLRSLVESGAKCL